MLGASLPTAYPTRKRRQTYVRMRTKRTFVQSAIVARALVRARKARDGRERRGLAGHGPPEPDVLIRLGDTDVVGPDFREVMRCVDTATDDSRVHPRPLLVPASRRGRGDRIRGGLGHGTRDPGISAAARRCCMVLADRPCLDGQSACRTATPRVAQEASRTRARGAGATAGLTVPRFRPKRQRRGGDGDPLRAAGQASVRVRLRARSSRPWRTTCGSTAPRSSSCRRPR